MTTHALYSASEGFVLYQEGREGGRISVPGEDDVTGLPEKRSTRPSVGSGDEVSTRKGRRSSPEETVDSTTARRRDGREVGVSQLDQESQEVRREEEDATNLPPNPFPRGQLLTVPFAST